MEGTLRVRVLPEKEKDAEAATYRDYFEHDEPGKDIPSHRLLAILRGEREGFLISDLRIEDEREVERLGRSWRLPLETPAAGRSPRPRRTATSGCCGRRSPTRSAPRCASGPRPRPSPCSAPTWRHCSSRRRSARSRSWGSIPAIARAASWPWWTAPAAWWRRTSSIRIQPHADEAGSAKTVVSLIQKHGVHAVAVGNGTASRETEAFARKAVQEAGLDKVVVAIVPETGASVYSASAVAREELPDARRVAARRRLHRPPPPGPAGRAGEDRAQAPSASASTSTTSTRNRWSGSWTTAVEGAREPRGRGAQHGLGLAAAAGLGPLRAPGQHHRAPPRLSNGPFPLPQVAPQGRRLRPQDLRAGRRLPPHP